MISVPFLSQCYCCCDRSFASGVLPQRAVGVPGGQQIESRGGLLCRNIDPSGQENAIFSTLCPYNPLFWPQTDPAQWDHIFPIYPGNFGCLQFSGRCPFVRSAGRSIFSMLRLYNPLFWPQTDPAQWDHIIPISPGNSGYLRFSSMCPFSCLVGCFLTLIA